ncbi:hypothetical protein ACRFV7_000953 [Klebsiella oxytoca]
MYQDEYFHVTMPTVFAREDAPWIKEQLAALPAGMREKIAMAYAGKNRDGVCAGVPGGVRRRTGFIPAAERSTTNGKPPIARVLHEIYPSSQGIYLAPTQGMNF